MIKKIFQKKENTSKNFWNMIKNLYKVLLLIWVMLIFFLYSEILWHNNTNIIIKWIFSFMIWSNVFFLLYWKYYKKDILLPINNFFITNKDKLIIWITTWITVVLFKKLLDIFF
jgi:hypothetical protein